MLRTTPCPSCRSSSWADDLGIRHCADWRATGEKQQLRQQTVVQPELLPFFGASISCSKPNTSSGSYFSSHSRAASAQTFSSLCRLNQGLNGELGGSNGRNTVGSAGFRESGRQNVKEQTFGSRDSGLFKMQVLGKVGNKSSGDGEVRVEMEDNVVQILDREKAAGQRGGGMVDGTLNVQIEKMSHNSRKLVARITIGAPLEVVWGILTDYEHLADFLPGLAVSELLEKRVNGARLYQVGEQNLALGMKFKAKAVVDCEEKPEEVHENVIRRDINFETVEGDFQIFQGTWRMEQQVSATLSDSRTVGGLVEEIVTTLLSYTLVVQPKIWLPVGLIEGRLTSEIKTNLVCIRDRCFQISVS